MQRSEKAENAISQNWSKKQNYQVICNYLKIFSTGGDRFLVLKFKISRKYIFSYSPVSLLATFSKMYSSCFKRFQIKTIHCTNYSMDLGLTCHAVYARLTSQNTLLNSLNKNKVSLQHLIDSSKVFDMIYHENLLYKQQYYGICSIIYLVGK